VQVVAPGVNVPAQGRDGLYWQVSGTSPACALVAGVVALIKARYPRLPPVLVGNAIISTTHDRPAGGYDDSVGFGMVDAAAALARAKNLARDFTAAAPTAATSPGAVMNAGEHYGGGPSHAVSTPVRPRATWPLVGFGLLGVTSLALIAAGLVRIAGARRSRPPPAWPPPGPPPQEPAPSPQEPA
jgi:hypothetical protein